MNSIILTGVTLGNRTIVGAGSIVTKSFPEGNVVIAGNPAKIIKRLDDNYEDNLNDNTPKYYGFLSKEEFAHKKARYIDL